ncbi:MAG: prenyltransferase [Candidatus Aminicenantia bacterium]
MNISIWRKALLVIPRIEKEEFIKLDFISKWLIITRSAVLVMTLISCLIGGILAIRDKNFNLLNFLLCTIGLILAHATNNMINDFVDHKKGVDRNNYFRAQYGPHPLEHELMKEKEFFVYLAITGLIAFSIGIFLVYSKGFYALALFGAGIFFVLFYTFPLKYLGLGEVAVLIVWGPLMVGGTYFITTANINWNVILASLPYAIGTTTVIFGKHIDKYEMDKIKGIRTLPVLIGEKASRYVVISMMLLMFIIVFYIIFKGYFSFPLLIVLFSTKTLKLAIKEYLSPKPDTRPEICPPDVWPLWFVAIAFLFNRRFGFLYLSGLVLDTIAKSLHIL